jgi:FkbM family methyltransferase
MIMFDIGANRGDAVIAGLKKGYKVIALEPAPKIYKELVKNYIYTNNVITLKLAVSNTNDENVEFYEADEDGLSTMNKDWLTSDSMPYQGKPFRTINAVTITIDRLAELYGSPNLIKIDVEGAEWSVFKGMTKYHGMLTFEWTINTIEEHIEQIKYLQKLGYTQIGPQFIEHHLQDPDRWFDINSFDFKNWIDINSKIWVDGKWKNSNLRPTADVGMCWLV